MSMKNSLTLAGIEPATYGFVAQHLNHCATAVPVGGVYISNFHSKFLTAHASGSLVIVKQKSKD